MTQQTLIILIICCVVAIILGMFVGGWAKIMDKGSDVEVCRSSIILAAQSKKIGNEAWTPLDCPRKDLLIKRGDVVRKGVIDQERVHKIVADAMAECWYMFGEGKMDPFSNWGKGAQEENLCIICKNIQFDDRLISFIGSKQDEMIDDNGVIINETFKQYYPMNPSLYLMENNYKTTGKTYYEYLYNLEPGIVEETEREQLSMIPLAPESIILLNMYKYKYKNRFWQIVGISTAVLLVVGGLVLGVCTFGAGFVVTAASLSILAGVLAAVGGGIALGAHTLHETFKYCTECEGVGGIKIYPPGIDLSKEETICIKNCEDPDEEKWQKDEVAACTIIVN